MATCANDCWLRRFAAVVVGVGTLLTCAQGARGQVAYELFHAFPSLQGGIVSAPGPLVQASDGNFYGTTASDGAKVCGGVFKITPAGAFTTLRFFPDAPEGCTPSAASSRPTKAIST